MKRSNLLITLLAGIIIVLFAWQRLHQQEPAGIQMEAKVTDIVAQNAQDYRITVSYNPKRHETFHGNFSQNSKPEYEIGDTISIFYHPNDTQNVIPTN